VTIKCLNRREVNKKPGRDGIVERSADNPTQYYVNCCPWVQIRFRFLPMVEMTDDASSGDLLAAPSALSSIPLTKSPFSSSFPAVLTI